MYRPHHILNWQTIRCFVAYGVLTFTVPISTHALEDILVSTQEAEFDSTFLIGDAKKIDIDRFKYGNPILAGEYSVDIYVNGNWFGKRHLIFTSSNNKENAYTCFTAPKLLEFGVKQELLQHKNSDLNSPSCLSIEQWIDQASYEFDTSKLRLDISIPQVAIEKNAQGYVDPSVWDRGINAGFLSYNASVYTTIDKFQDHQQRTNAFTSINAGANLWGWQLRHNGQWQWQEQTENQAQSSSYEVINSYLQRAFPQYRGVLTLGDHFTDGEIFDSFGYRGIDFTSDDRMLPNSMIGYAPRIRGNAKSNAKVEIRQQGQLIYQTSVAAGNFEINDLYPTGFGGELEVSVIEANGEIQRFSVPYSSVVQMLRPGLSRYSLTAGQFRDQDLNSNPWIVQAKYQRGLNNYLTAYGGIQATERYSAVSLGSAFATPIGAVALDVTQSNMHFDHRPSASGQSYRISYSKLISSTDTNFTLAAYRYSTENFFKLREALISQELDEKSISAESIGKQRSEFQITLNQGLPLGWGNIYALGSLVDYWNRNETTRQYQLGYSNNWGQLSYSISAIKKQVENGISKQNHDDTEYMLSLSIPLSFKKHAINITSMSTKNNQTLGLNGTFNERLSYGATASGEFGQAPSLNINAQYRTDAISLGGAYSYSNTFEQIMLNARGNIVAHKKGFLFGPDQGQTMVLVYAPDARGAKVNNGVGLNINKAGYAVVPYVTPYRLNDISLDPQNMSANVELEESSQRIAPFAGAIAQVNFATKSGKAIYIQSTQTNGTALPFASDVYDSQGQNIGMVAQGSLVYLRSNVLSDRIQIKWGEAEDQQCHIQYDLSNLPKDQHILMMEAICQ
ncbi:fimbria/pilus outer membrane usher protein [Acinetobacter bouvetii]|uniref:Outer membrane usher protein HtrE n=1 Tax=Acinetobacter bouvetii TaxID=202951 RepID=A0A811G950_9GAMM|nr:fimbria/pilus outer membrane usher protein [Acinetobacter bouvetii]CAB1213699.1 Outer membrane usher protein HtrE [Acinetobacter bouvetii]